MQVQTPGSLHLVSSSVQLRRWNMRLRGHPTLIFSFGNTDDALNLRNKGVCFLLRRTFLLSGSDSLTFLTLPAGTSFSAGIRHIVWI